MEYCPWVSDGIRLGSLDAGFINKSGLAADDAGFGGGAGTSFIDP
jgi:hypothetical protein